jgi:hypothetical protein
MKSPNYYRVRALVRAVFWLCTIGGAIGGTLPDQLPPMVYGRGLLLGSGVRAMSDTDPLKNKFWNCPKCGKLNLGAWCPCEREKESK